MDLNCFFEALEDIASRLYSNRRDTYDNLNSIILNVVEQLWDTSWQYSLPTNKKPKIGWKPE